MYRTTIIQNKFISIICSYIFFCPTNIYRPSLGKVWLGRPNSKLIPALNFYLRRRKKTIILRILCTTMVLFFYFFCCSSPAYGAVPLPATNPEMQVRTDLPRSLGHLEWGFTSLNTN